ncbi:preprotein translocase subunit SecE [Candidatus Micrarchaeota archaeon CG08_land_8_20_14_0_20_49_17]|nr:MAG: preprotein translocase subunit SecE [Candidatus Micrarchaeota archaeon CG08_land_8_20_14_0_20_49_17]PIZ98604.1 MAG: preprotein translocase subunit SecE [Candidatus Micrarchaeota archaeon CG_4_10_14_0_2_um_filter_49_7]HII54321.1 preprotein translocase subunit SecE [Candidatus Micrarchaeota archaeon]
MIGVDLFWRFARVLNLATIPDMDEIMEITKVSIAGIVVIGIFGSVISLVLSYL